jgi:hypothetical protein
MEDQNGLIFICASLEQFLSDHVDALNQNELLIENNHVSPWSSISYKSANHDHGLAVCAQAKFEML